MAHALAKKALDAHDLTVWMGELPPDLISVSLQDFNQQNQLTFHLNLKK